MSLAPLMNARLTIQLHADAGHGGVRAGGVQLSGVKRPRGTVRWGYAWVTLTLIVADSASWSPRPTASGAPGA